MQAGMLNHRVQISRPTKTNVDGEMVTTWTDLGTYWALVQIQGGNESVSFTQIQGQRLYKITLRAKAITCQVNDRITYKGRDIEVTSVSPDEQLILQILTAKENV